MWPRPYLDGCIATMVGAVLQPYVQREQLGLGVGPDGAATQRAGQWHVQHVAQRQVHARLVPVRLAAHVDDILAARVGCDRERATGQHNSNLVFFFSFFLSAFLHRRRRKCDRLVSFKIQHVDWACLIENLSRPAVEFWVTQTS